MRPSTTGKTSHRTSVLVLVLCIAALMLMMGIPASASAHAAGTPAVANWGSHTIVVKPNGSNDTADLQAAFNTCTSHNWVCTIQLVKGTYYTDQVYAIGFQGSFVGAGQGATIIQGLPNLPSPGAAYNTSMSPFWAALPGPTNPWPDLFTFVNGAFRVSQMTLVDTYFNPVPNGWNYFGLASTYLWADIMVTGEQANAAFDHFAMITGPGEFNIGIGNPSSFNSAGGLVYEGMLLPSGWQPQGYPTAYTDQIPVSGTFSVTNCYLYGTDSAVWVENTLDASVTIGFNLITSSPSMISPIDLSNTQVWVYGNQLTNVMYGAGVIPFQSLFQYNLLPSTIYVMGNYVEVNWGGSGLFFSDYGPGEGLPSTLSVVAAGNTVVTDTSCGCYTIGYPVIWGWDLSSFVVSGNTVLSGGAGVEIANLPGNVGWVSGNTILGAMAGVLLGASTLIGSAFTGPVYGIHVTANVIKNSVDYGIAVVGGSSNNTVAFNLVKGSGLYDLYWDQTGTNDLWYGNIYATSSPATLP